jgi:hypothetical protein
MLNKLPLNVRLRFEGRGHFTPLPCFDDTSCLFLALSNLTETKMRIKKAVITAAARGERLYPVSDTIQKAMLPVIDVDGLHKPVLQIICEEAFSSGIEEICVICAPGDGERYKNAFTTLKENLLKSYTGIDWPKKKQKS